MIYAENGKWEEAERKLLLAQKLGMPAEDVQKALADGIRSRASFYRWLRRGGYTFMVWLPVLAILFFLGAFLSQLTLATVYRSHSAGRPTIGAGERLIRAVYRVVIIITSLYFYFSIPFLIAGVLIGVGAVFYLFSVIGFISLELAALVGLIACFTIYATVRGLFTRVKEAEPGRPLVRSETPHVWALAEEVAEKLNTRPIEAIYITPGPEVAVKERGSWWKKLFGYGQRCLILGMGVLPGMTQDQFKAILAHEYGHFSHHDTSGGNLARRVQISIHRMAAGLASKGQTYNLNPAWLFLKGFNSIFLRITLGASRLNEILADRYAAKAYGVQNIIDGLMHTTRQAHILNLQVTTEIETSRKQSRSLNNLYTLPPLQEGVQRDLIESKIAETMNRPTAPYDSHPALRERIALLQQLRASGSLEENSFNVNSHPALDLLPQAEALQAEMTALVQKNVSGRQNVPRS